VEHASERYASYNLNLAPIGSEQSNIGVINLVSMDPISTNIERVGSAQNHFLQEAADSNMNSLYTQPLHSVTRGKLAVQQQQRSRIMARSSHVMYRRLGHSLEITILQGVSSYELSLLVGKLGAHRVSTVDSLVSFTAPKRQSLGSLDRLDLEKLRDTLLSMLEDHRRIRILITDKHETKGILQKPAGYTRRINAVIQKEQMVI
jgi:hypothetical protein